MYRYKGYPESLISEDKTKTEQKGTGSSYFPGLVSIQSLIGLLEEVPLITDWDGKEIRIGNRIKSKVFPWFLFYLRIEGLARRWNRRDE